ncbi:MAG: S8 family serine peptidase [Proteobacteria bacterium]|nr:S8 family serine peptidase [Pseudomonadota bacterium]
MSRLKSNPLIIVSVMAAVYMAGVSNVSNATDQNKISSLVPEISILGTAQFIIPAANAQGQQRYIIRFKEPAVAGYRGIGQLAAIPRNADNSIQTNAPATQSYVAHLKTQQNTFLSSVSGSLGRNIAASMSYQYAYNGMTVYLAANEVFMVNSFNQVAEIMLDKDYFLDTDAGPLLIGADNVWTGTTPAAGSAFGEGVVIGTLDSGINFDHPSFADIGGDNYDHTNPLGSGNYLGVCDSANTDQFDAAYTCNDKLIGGYDFVNALVPPGGTDIPGPEDEDGHGSHVASTSGGNVVNSAEINGVTGIKISGVAPHVNIVMFDVCYTAANGRALCSGAASLAAVDQALADGIVDIINFSISGGVSPWTDPVSQAFLNATDSGIFVATSAGNSGPGSGTLGHVEPWTSSSGASTHNRRFSNDVNITGPATATVPMNLTDLFAVQGDGPAMVVDMVGTINYSGIVDAGNVNGCAAFAANAFDGVVALISRGGCGFATKVNNAEAAGATGVIVHNNVPGSDPFGMGALAATNLPSVMIGQVAGADMVAFITANPTATVSAAFMTTLNFGALADSMAPFSSRGPSPIEYNKPDVTAPGVNILAAFDDDDVGTGTAAEYGIISGTSMSSPHNAGSAALIKELNPSWSASEIKSAIMMTAVTVGITKEDGVTPADLFDRGAGRVQVDVASSTGLVMNETALRFLAADPDNGGDPKTLNVPSITDFNCENSCSFEREFRSVATSLVNYTASITGLTGTVNPASFAISPGQTITLNIEIDGSASPIGVHSFGELVIEADTSGSSFSINPDNTAIPDGSYDGTLASMACELVTVSGVDPQTITGVSLELGVDHPWAGNLVVKLQNPDGDVLTVMNRPGAAELADDGGTGGFGDSSNLQAASPVTYVDGASTSAENLGASISGAQSACLDDGICDYSPAPGAVATPPASLNEMITGTVNGDWNICVGDSVLFNSGEIDNITLNMLKELVPELHLPAVIIGFPHQPIVDVTPDQIEVSVAVGGSDNQIINISNSGLVADLNWTIAGTGSVPNYTINQPGIFTNTSLSTQITPFGGAGVYTADSFVVAGDNNLIETISFQGVTNGNLLADSTAVTVSIYADNNGVPAGNPVIGNEVFTISLAPDDPNLDLGNGSGSINFDILGANGAGVELPAGTYWITAFPTVSNTNFWFMFKGVDITPGNAQLIDPSDLFGGGFVNWTDRGPVFAGMAYSLSNELNCGAPWLSASINSGATAATTNVDVTVTMDSTGLAVGVYRAAICINTNDFDRPLMSVPVIMAVSDIIFANGFEN